MRSYTSRFNTILCDELGETYKDADKGVHNLVRFIGRKKSLSDGLNIPFVAGIIQRVNDGKKELYLQKRTNSNPTKYYGTLEFSAGVLDVPYERIEDAIAREIHEETGTKLENIVHFDKTKDYSPNNDGSYGFKPFCCVKQVKDGAPWVGFIFVCEVSGEIQNQVSESADGRWYSYDEVKDMFMQTTEKFFTLELPAWEYYFENE